MTGFDLSREVKHPTTFCKNYAYEILSEQSAGEIIMFIGVDIRLHMNSIRTSVSLIEKNIDMLTIMPKRTQMGLVAMIIQPMRYWWGDCCPKKLS